VSFVFIRNTAVDTNQQRSHYSIIYLVQNTQVQNKAQ